MHGVCKREGMSMHASHVFITWIYVFVGYTQKFESRGLLEYVGMDLQAER